MIATALEQAAALLADARLQGRRLEDLPSACMPRSFEDAYALQSRVTARLGPVGAWKVQLPKPGVAARGTAIAAQYVSSTGASWPSAQPPRLEVEVALRFGRDLPPRATSYSPDEVLAAIDAAHLVFELLGHRFLARERVSELTYLADGQGNAGVVVGDQLPGWQDAPLERLHVELHSGERMLAQADTGPSLRHSLEGVHWVIEQAAAHGAGVKRGQLVLTGARIGGIAVPREERLEARAAGARVAVTML